jgi:TRAP-type C4-dicarboxylate transport system permease small subunit
MSALRSLIIALIILGAGIFIIQRLGEGFLKQSGLPVEINQFADLITGTRGLTNIILMGIGALVVLLIIVWIVRKIQTRHAARPPAMPKMPEMLRAAEEEQPAEEEETEEREEAPPEEEEESEEEK